MICLDKTFVEFAAYAYECDNEIESQQKANDESNETSDRRSVIGNIVSHRRRLIPVRSYSVCAIAPIITN